MSKFSIHLNQDSIATGTLSIGWHCPKNIFDLFETCGIEDPHVLIIISPVNKYSAFKEQREVVPLRDLIGYIELRSKGEHYIRAFICEKGNRYTAKSNGIYTETLLEYKGEEWYRPLRRSKTSNLYSEPLIIDIPSECFAQEPSEWEKIWVNWLVSVKALDQCQFRKRRLFAYTVQPFIFFLSFIVNCLLTLIAFLVGSRGANFNSILSPLEYTIPSNFDNLFCGGCKYFSVSEEKSWFNRVKFLPFMPAVLLVEGAAAALIFGNFEKHHGLDVFIHVYLIVAVILLALLLIISISISIEAHKEHQKSVAPLWYKNDEERDLLSQEDSKLTRLADLPSQKRNLKLRFLDLKQRVCRPFSQ